MILLAYMLVLKPTKSLQEHWHFLGHFMEFSLNSLKEKKKTHTWSFYSHSQPTKESLAMANSLNNVQNKP